MLHTSSYHLSIRASDSSDLSDLSDLSEKVPPPIKPPQ